MSCLRKVDRFRIRTICYFSMNPVEVIFVPAADKSPHEWLRDHSHLYCVIDEAYIGKTKLRKLNSRKEIKDIEKWSSPIIPKSFDDLPYQWKITYHLMKNWSQKVKHQGVKFCVAFHMAYYHAGENRLLVGSNHPWGFNFDRIPERCYMKWICKELNIPVIDTYEGAKTQEIDTRNFYIHPRYGYSNEQATLSCTGNR